MSLRRDATQLSECAYLCFAYGETDLPVALIANSRADVLQFFVDEWFGEQPETMHPETRSQYEAAVTHFDTHDWREEGPLEWRFEIGGITITKVSPSSAVEAQGERPNFLPRGWSIKVQDDGYVVTHKDEGSVFVRETHEHSIAELILFYLAHDLMDPELWANRRWPTPPSSIAAHAHGPECRQLRGAERDQHIHEHDCPKAWDFHRKYAMGSMLCPSCLLCGQQRFDREEWAIRHAELSDIYICKTCVDAARAQSSAKEASIPAPLSAEGESGLTALEPCSVCGEAIRGNFVKIAHGTMHEKCYYRKEQIKRGARKGNNGRPEGCCPGPGRKKPVARR